MMGGWSILDIKTKILEIVVIHKIENHLRGFMTKTCNQLRTEILLPLDVTKHYNVVGVHLNEPECAGSKNSTHWILETKRYFTS